MSRAPLVGPQAIVVELFAPPHLASGHAQVKYTLKDALLELRRYICPTTIIVGHSLDSDLKVLKLYHQCVIDTAVLFPHPSGLPTKRSLKDLVQEHLGISIQTGTGAVFLGRWFTDQTV